VSVPKQFIVFILLGLAGKLATATTIAGADGLTASVDPNGTYYLWVPSTGWYFSGNIGAPLTNISVSTSADAVGGYSEISFQFQTDAARTASIRVYGNRQLALFTAAAPAGAPNTFPFPNWVQYPHHLQQMTYSGIFAPPAFHSSAKEGPWVFFDPSGNTFIISPASHFMVSTTGWGPNLELASGISNQITTLPTGFTHRTLIALDAGINRTFDSWGNALMSLLGKTRPANDADISLRQIGYWTDNGATYYYQTGNSLSYEQTLAAIKADFEQAKIGLGYIQLDSWFYPKGQNAAWTANGSGIYQYLAAPALFPDGLGNFQRSLGTSLVTHARWIDPSSPYHQQYTMSGNVVTDPTYWSMVAMYLAGSGVSTYEQDWLGDKAQANFDLTNPDLFLNNMAAAMAQQKLTIQYCMASARHFLQSLWHNNVTTIRTSEDRMQRSHWTNFLYTSRLASALGLWPFSDVLMSTETGNLLLATLSAGPVGVGDPIGSLNAANLAKAARADGVIVKPDLPATPIDSSYLAAAQAPSLAQITTPQIAATYTDFGGLRAYYVLAYTPAGNSAAATFQPADFGMSQRAYLYNYFAETGQVANPGDSVTMLGADPLYVVAAPIGRSGIAVLGDLAQFVSLGKKRVSALRDDGMAHVTVEFAPGENSRVISGYSRMMPTAQADDGSVGTISYDSRTGLFHVPVTPGADGNAEIRIEALREREPRPTAR
jgi:hypothetical protein